MNGGSDLYRNSHSSKLPFTSDGLPFYRRNGNQKENGREAKRMPSNTYPNGKGKGKTRKGSNGAAVYNSPNRKMGEWK